MAIGITVKNAQIIETGDQSVGTATVSWASDDGVPLNAGAGERFISVNIQVAVAFHASATGDARVHLRKSADNATTEDTYGDSTAVLTIPVSAGNTVIRTIPAYDFDYLDVGVQNEDAAQVLTYNAKWEGLYYTGLAT